ncbi:hypothetical protein [Cupriavidus basilensis]|uniref:hypothetical protein n=1 Tax=Cupriavidus basilensis TaxID=68895 RepID=UPI0020A6CEDF|nr:hypothetical protein [Cupriavidus basilensis]MCP3025196.1 hypothetical protein [Cupriavidus basilensis]
MRIYESWQTEKSIVKALDNGFDGHEARWVNNKYELETYSSGKNPFKDLVDDLKIASPPLAIRVELALAYYGRDHALVMKSMFSSKSGEWLPHLTKYMAYAYWKRLLDNRTLYSTKSFGGTVCNISDCLYLGWLDKTELLVKEAHSAYSAKRFYDVADIYSQPLYHFLLRICFDWCHLKFEGWGTGYYDTVKDPYAPGECLGEPVINELFAHWKDPDLSGMQNALQWLCDYYTHRTVSKDGVEFGNDLLHTRFPALVLAWFRLRESLGLTNPVIDHPLMRPHYAQLPPPQPFFTDDLLDGVIARLRREELPDLGISPAEVAPRDPPEEPRRGLLARLLGK